MAIGFAGTTLRIDLASGEIKKLPTDEKLMREWYGGRGIVAKICYDEVPRDADPLGPDNVFILTAGILSGPISPGGSKVEFGSVSPLTNGQGDSNMGGHLGPALKFAGYDLIIFKGISPKPVYLFIDNDRVEIRDASKYWGMGSLDCEDAMKHDLGDEFEIATIGPAGEKHPVFLHHPRFRATGRENRPGSRNGFQEN